MINKAEYELLLRALDGASDAANSQREDSGSEDSPSEDSPVERTELVRLIGPATRFEPGFIDDVMRIVNDSTSATRQHARVFTLRRVAVAATVLVAVALGAAILRSPQATRMMVEPASTVLADGTVVTLAPGSLLSTSNDFADARVVDLTGEAFFDVTQTGSPFTVRLAEGNIVVTGTSFNARSWPDQLDYAEVTLVEGSVHIESHDGASTELVAGQSIRFTDETIMVPAASDTTRLLAWRSGAFGFRDVSVDFAFGEIGRRYGVVIAFDDGVDLTRRITYLSRRSGNLTDVMSDLCTALGLQYRSTRSGYEISQSK